MTEMNQDTLVASEWIKVQEIIELLEPFAVQTDMLQTDASSLSIVIPSLLDLECHLLQFKQAKVLTGTLLIKFRSRFEQILQPQNPTFNPIPAAACLLDPTVGSCMLDDELSGILWAAKLYVILQATKAENERDASSVGGTSVTALSALSTTSAPALKKFKFLSAKMSDTLVRYYANTFSSYLLTIATLITQQYNANNFTE